MYETTDVMGLMMKHDGYDRQNKQGSYDNPFLGTLLTMKENRFLHVQFRRCADT